MIRAFIAVDLPAEVRAALQEALVSLKRAHLGIKVSWTKVENLHLTLQFLGDVDESAIPRISAALADVAGQQPAFAVPVGGLGAFPDERRPRVLWVGCQDAAGRLAQLAGAVQRATRTLGFPPEDRKFAAHLTLGRIKSPRPDPALTRAVDSFKNNAFGTLRVGAIHLFQSQLHPAGSIYTKLSSHELKEI